MNHAVLVDIGKILGAYRHLYYFIRHQHCLSGHQWLFRVTIVFLVGSFLVGCHKHLSVIIETSAHTASLIEANDGLSCIASILCGYKILINIISFMRIKLNLTGNLKSLPSSDLRVLVPPVAISIAFCVIGKTPLFIGVSGIRMPIVIRVSQKLSVSLFEVQLDTRHEIGTWLV